MTRADDRLLSRKTPLGHCLPPVSRSCWQARPGAESAVPATFRVPYDVRDNPAEQAVPLRAIVKGGVVLND